MDPLLQRAAVVAEARTWLATPFHHHGRIKGAGVDCAQILCAVYEACGIVPHIELGNYSPQWHLHHGDEVYLRWLARAGAREVQAPAPGDVAVYRFGRCFSHGAIVVEPGLMLHSYLGRGVHLSRSGEAPLAGRPVQYWSLWRSGLDDGDGNDASDDARNASGARAAPMQPLHATA